MYIKALLFAGVACCGASLWAFSSVITETKTDQDEKTGAVTVTYKLTGEDAVITADVQTNSAQNKAWASIGPANYTGMTGEVWKKVTADGSVRTISWPTLADGETKPPKFDKHVRVVLTAWSTNAPPDYLVINLNYNKSTPPAYYTDEALLPEGGSVTNKAYKEDQLVLKRMHAAGVTWMMSNDYVAKQGINTVSCRRSSEIAHPVMLTHDYYIGVFTVTRAQYGAVSGSFNPLSEYIGVEAVCSYLPIMRVTYETARGGSGFLYPDAPKSTSVVGWFRAKTGDTTLDLPSEAEWEFAARGGHYGELWGDGTTVGNNNWDAHLNALGRNNKNKSASTITDGTAGSYAFCGSYKPNDYGLYDMNGNVYDWCLDWYQEGITWNAAGVPNAKGVNTLDPADPSKASGTTGTQRVARGGYYNGSTQYCRNSFRRALEPSSYQGVNDFSVRLVSRDGLK